MRVAIVTDDLIQRGGQESLVMDVCAMYPDPILFTTIASKHWQRECKQRGIHLITSFMQRLPFGVKLNRMYSVYGLHTLALERFNFSDFDLVLSVSARYAHQVITKPSTVHICYMNSPGRMLWESSEYFKHERVGKLKWLLSYPLQYLRIVDRIASNRPDFFIANAKTPQARIKKYYKRESTVVYPPVHIENFQKPSKDPEIMPYFLVISRLVSWKRLDLAILACNELGLHLKIVGEGPDESRLKSCAGPNIEFLGYVSDSEKRGLMSSCQALIFPQQEDFGITPVEAMACGRPVIAFAGGGALETVLSGETGEYFKEQTVKSLLDVLKDFDGTKYDSDKCRLQAAKFSVSIFKSKMKAIINDVYLEHVNFL